MHTSHKAQFNIRQTRNGTPVVELDGDIDYYDSEALRETWDNLKVNLARGVIVDMRRVQYMDSTGLAFLVRLVRQFHCDRARLVIMGANATIQLLLQLTGVIQVVSLVESEPEALHLVGG